MDEQTNKILESARNNLKLIEQNTNATFDYSEASLETAQKILSTLKDSNIPENRRGLVFASLAIYLADVMIKNLGATKIEITQDEVTKKIIKIKVITRSGSKVPVLQWVLEAYKTPTENNLVSRYKENRDYFKDFVKPQTAISNLSKLVIPQAKELGFELVQGSDKTTDKTFQKPITCGSGPGFAIIQSHISSYELSAENESFHIGSSLQSFDKGQSFVSRDFEEENKILSKELSEAGVKFDYRFLKTSDPVAQEYEKFFEVVKKLEEQGIFQRMLTEQYKMRDEAAKFKVDARKIIDYIIPTFKEKFPQFSEFKDNFDKYNLVSFSSTKANEYGLPEIILEMSKRGLIIKSVNIPHPESFYTSPYSDPVKAAENKTQEMERNKKINFLYWLWYPSDEKGSTEHSFTAADISQAKVVIKEAFDYLEKYLQERIA